MGKKHFKVAILFSGGWDSVLCAIKRPDADLIFIDYGQRYAHRELMSATNIAKEMGRELNYFSHLIGHDAKNRNFHLIDLVSQKYDEIILGSRNILPIFDKYKDSNWLSLKLFGFLYRVKITLPITGYSKRKIVKEVMSKIKNIPYNCYENKKQNENCSCVNCIEMKKLGVKNVPINKAF